MIALAKRDPFKIGLVAVAVAALLGVGVVLLSVVNFGTQTYTAVVAQTAGLRVGEDVQVSGVPSGKITGVALDGNVVKVTFALDKEIRLGNRSRAAIRVATLLGTHYLAVSPDGSGELPGRTIPLARTSVPYNLQDVLEKGTQSLQQLDPVLLAKALTEASKTMSASSDQVGPALEGVARLSTMVTGRTDQLQDLLQATRKVTDQLADGSGDLIVMMRQANLVIEEITRRRAAIHTLLVETTTLSKNLGGIIKDTRADLEPAARNLNLVLATLREQDATLKKLLTTMAPTVRHFANATGNGPWADLWWEAPALPPDDLLCKLGGC